MTNTRTMLKYATRKAIKYFIFKCARLQLKVVKNAHQIALLKSYLKPCEYWLFIFKTVQECKVCLCEQTYKYICLIKQKKTDSNIAFESVLIGWGSRARTQTYRVRVCCATITQIPYEQMVLYNSRTVLSIVFWKFLKNFFHSWIWRKIII